jgi:type II secretory pathway component PulM
VNLPNLSIPKLSSDQIKKLALSAMGFIFLLYVYFTFFLGPLQRMRGSTLSQITEIKQKIDGSKNEMAKATSLERQAKDATSRFAALKALSPDGAPIAWFPPRMKAFFGDQQIDKAVARLESNTTFKQTELAAWTKYNWVIDLPQADFAALGKCIADLENKEPLLSITKLSVRVLPSDPQFQQVAIAATTVIQQR